jgi:hypothetical protein
LQDQAEAQEVETLKLFGENSEELKALEASNDKELLELSKTNDKIGEAQEQAHKDNLLAIKKDSADVAAATQAEIDAKELKDQKAANQKKEDEDKESEEKRLALKRETVNAAISIFNSGFDLIEKLSAIGAEAEQRRFDESIEARRKGIESLSADLQGATGLQRQFLEQQVKQEKEALEEEEKAREKAEKKRAQSAKILALFQAGINGAVAITRACSDLGPIAGAVAAVGVGAAIIAQVADINAQKFIEGGLVGANDIRNLGDGKITGSSNIGVQSNGDNILATVKTGEVILNEKQQAKLGGASTFASIGVPGFASGGVIGAPSVAPNVVSTSDKILVALDAKTDAINNRIDNINVALDVNNLQDFEDNEAQQVTLTTLG